MFAVTAFPFKVFLSIFKTLFTKRLHPGRSHLVPCHITLQINADVLFEVPGLKNTAVVLTTEGHQNASL